MNKLILINENQEPVVSGRTLHEFLAVETPYVQWFIRMTEYGFEPDRDFCTNLCESTGGRPSTDHILKLDMAKELCMLARSDKGKQARQYFIEVEKEHNSPEKVMARALRYADIELNKQKMVVSQLSVSNAIMAPKADYFDQVVDRNLLTGFRDTAKALQVPEKVFINFLLEKKYVYRDKKGKLTPYADKNSGLFETKECMNDKTQWAGTQTLITPKGRETFRLLCKGLPDKAAIKTK